MPRGDNPNSRANLKPFTSEQSRETAVKNGKKGAEASNKKQAEKRTMQQIALEILQRQAGDSEQWKTIAKKRGIQTDTSIKELMFLCCLDNAAKRGNLDDIAKLMDMIGEQKGGSENTSPDDPISAALKEEAAAYGTVGKAKTDP